MLNKPKKYYEVAAISKACRLIEMLSSQPSWELAALCKAMGMPKTTVHRMLLTLEDNGFVIQEKLRGEYCLSYKLFSIGSRMVSHSSFIDIARPFCRDLLKAVDETVNLCVVSGTEMLVVDKQVTTQMLRQDSLVGSSFPLFQSASGKIFLAFAEKEETDRAIALIAKGNPKLSTQSIVNELNAELETIKKTGVAYDYEEVFQGVRCVAAPIFDYNGKLLATLSISTPTVRLNKTATQNIEDNLKKTVSNISRRLGAPAGSLPY